MGRQTTYTQDQADAICERLAEGHTLREVCRAEGMPPESTVRLWAINDVEGFAAQYARAREIGYHSMVDETIEIADNAQNDWMERNGEEDEGWQFNGEHLQRSRLRVDTRKWLVSKALPKIYGDKITSEISGPDGGAIKTEETGSGAAKLMGYLDAIASRADSSPSE